MALIEEPDFDLYQLVIVHLDGGQHVTKILRRYYVIDQGQWVYGVRGLDELYPAEMIDFKTKRHDQIERQLKLGFQSGRESESTVAQPKAPWRRMALAGLASVRERRTVAKGQV